MLCHAKQCDLCRQTPPSLGPLQSNQAVPGKPHGAGRRRVPPCARASAEHLRGGRRCLSGAEAPQAWRRGARLLSQLQAAWPTVREACADEATRTEVEVADALRVAGMAATFRSRGHLAAQLDPLGRAARGPWLAEAAERCRVSPLCAPRPPRRRSPARRAARRSPSPRARRQECGLPALLDGYCDAWPPARKAAYIAEQLSLQGSLDPERCAPRGPLRGWSRGERLAAGGARALAHARVRAGGSTSAAR
jgi:hypothetical protein